MLIPVDYKLFDAAPPKYCILVPVNHPISLSLSQLTHLSPCVTCLSLFLIYSLNIVSSTAIYAATNDRTWFTLYYISLCTTLHFLHAFL